jgi:hypothetical protein
MIPGNCPFHNDITIHKAGDNMTNGFRHFVVDAYIPDGAIFNGIQNILSDKYIHKLKTDNFQHDNKQNSLTCSKAHILS